MKNELRAWNTVTPENERRAGRFSVVDHREKNARTHILHLYLDPLPIAGGADPREPTANPANAHHSSSSSSIAVLFVISRLARGAGHGCVAVEVWYILHPYTGHGKRGGSYNSNSNSQK